jgi:hypothetical protein
MSGRFKLGALAVSALAAGALWVPVTALAGHGQPARRADVRHPAIRHVLAISVDGLHQSDLAWYVRNHPNSELAALAGGGAEYANAQTQIPSDSFPGTVGEFSGGDPRVTGVYYDDTYNHALLPPGTTKCTPGLALGSPVIYDSPLDQNVNALDAGQGLSGLPGSILKMTGSPQSLLIASGLPVDPKTCTPVYPHQYLRVNTVFNVAHDHGLRTAYSDKHPAYEILNGPAGNGIDDLFTPEIDSIALEPNGTPYPGDIAWTGDNAATMQYDSYKVQAIVNEIDGYDHSRSEQVGVPAIFGMNFQTVSTAEKLPTSDGLTGGYYPGTDDPAPLLQRALNYINDQLARIDNELRARHLWDSTAIILTAKHGQSPQNPNDLTRIDDGPIIAAINAAWTQAHPGAAALVAANTDDDAMMLWLSNRSHEATSFVKRYLLSHTATGNTAAGGSRTLASSGLVRVYAGRGAARYFGVPKGDPNHPDIWGVVQHGVVYTGGTGKIAEHGGADPEDRDVPLVVYAPAVVDPSVVSASVETTQIAPTILRLLGLDPQSLGAVRIEGTRVLPGLS